MRTQLARKAVVHSRNRLSACHRVPQESVDLLDGLNPCPYNNTHLSNVTRPLTACVLFSTIYNIVVLAGCGKKLQTSNVANVWNAYLICAVLTTSRRACTAMYHQS